MHEIFVGAGSRNTKYGVYTSLLVLDSSLSVSVISDIFNPHESQHPFMSVLATLEAVSMIIQHY